MKKSIALLLAALLILSAIPFAGAEFKDQKDVSFMTREAVEIMSDLKVVSGFPDGTFKPEDTLTRAQAAKILCCVALGTKATDALSATGSTFSDVPASHWANKFVEYCASKGIVAGVGNGKFNPDGKLTGFTFGKMLLVALGADPASLTGAGWDRNTEAQLKEKHLNYGVTANNKDLSRQDACRLALNALFCGEADDPENTLAFKSFGVVRVDDGRATKQYCRPFKKYSSTESDAYWSGDSKSIITSPVFFSKNGAVKGGDLYKALGVGDIEPADLVIYRNGVRGKDLADTQIHEGATKAYPNTGAGIRLEVYYAADTGKWTMIHLNYFPAKVASVVEAAYYSDGSVQTPGSVTFENGWSCESDAFKQSDVGNYALVYGMGPKTMTQITSAIEAWPGKVVEGELTAYDAKTGATIAGKSYKYAQNGSQEAKAYAEEGGAVGDTVKALISEDNLVFKIWKP